MDKVDVQNPSVYLYDDYEQTNQVNQPVVNRVSPIRISNYTQYIGKVEKDLSIPVRAMLDTIAWAEGMIGQGQFNGYDVGSGYVKIPNWSINYQLGCPQIKITFFNKRTKKVSFSLSKGYWGRYQYGIDTWKQVNGKNISFSKRNQDLTCAKHLSQILGSTIYNNIHSYMSDINGVFKLTEKLSKTWASIPFGKTERSYYTLTKDGVTSFQPSRTNKTFQDFYRTVPYLHGPRTYFNKELSGKIYRELYSFEGINIFSDVLEAKNMYNMPYDDQQIFMSTDDTRLEDILDYINTTANNTLHFIVANDFTDYIKLREKADNKIYTNVRVFFTNLVAKFTNMTDEGMLLNMRNFNVYMQPGIVNTHTDNRLNTLVKDGTLSKALMRNIIDESILNIRDIEQRNFVWSGYDTGIGMDLDLVNIFKDIEPNIFLPLVKYVSEGEVQLYNIYKPFFRNIDDKQKLIYLAGKDQILSLNENINSVYDKISVKRLKYLVNLDYLVFKWRLDDNNIMNVYLFESGFIICEFHTPAGYINFDKTVDLAGITNKILGKIKDKYKLNLDLPILNPEKLIKQTTGTVSYCDLINIKYKVTFDLVSKVVNGYKSWEQLFTGVASGKGKSVNILNKVIDKLKLQHNIS